MNIREILEQADKVDIIAEKNGTKVVSPSDAAALIKQEALDPTPDLGQRTVNPDGSIARSRTLVSQISKEFLYDNRYKRQGVKGSGYNEVWVVPAVDPKGYRAVVQGMQDKDIPAYIFSKQTDTGEIYLKGVTTVDYQKFHSEFTHKLDEEAMKQIMPFLASAGEGISSDALTDDLF